MKDVKYVCKNCGSDDVEELSWTKVNTNQYVSDANMEVWCPLCDTETELIAKTEFENLNDE